MRSISGHSSALLMVDKTLWYWIIWKNLTICHIYKNFSPVEQFVF